MKIKQLSLLLVLVIVSSVSFAQKIKIKKGNVTVDKVNTCKIEKDDVSRGAFYINNLQDEQLLYLKWIDWGQYGYMEIYKADNLDDILFETEVGIGYKKWIIKKLYNAKVLSSAGINEDKLNQFAKKFGREFTRKRNRY
ncbi:hypothetical protein [uncultured Winogradskyella sp.]|uniref:hypothetical protein n=1 Tax=uncultured Winogradskyella sp. TaxID=395353 RepID=UPI0026039182|nr:hypothetical protein [uncultured Winogradskyella sp.]